MKRSNVCLLRLLLFPFRPARTLRTHLVRAKVYPVEERLVRSRKCLRNRCRVCKNAVETDTFQSLVDKKLYKFNHRFTCSDKCLVYLLSCKVCGQKYTSQAVDEFRYRRSNYKDNNRKSLSGVDGGVNISKLGFLLISKV